MSLEYAQSYNDHLNMLESYGGPLDGDLSTSLEFQGSWWLVIYHYMFFYPFIELDLNY